MRDNDAADSVGVGEAAVECERDEVGVEDGGV